MDHRSVVGAHGDNQIYTIRDDGTGLTPVTTTPNWGEIAEWSPAGPSRIAFALTFETYDEYWSHPAVIGANGTGFQDLTPAATAHAAVAGVSWSPDGTRLAFIEAGNNARHLVVVNADGSGLDTIAGNPKLRLGGGLQTASSSPCATTTSTAGPWR